MTADEPRSQEAIATWLVSHIGEILGVDPSELDVEEPLTSYGLNSVAAFALAGTLEEWLQRDLPPTLLFEHPTIKSLAAQLARDSDASGSRQQPRSS